jgi:pilus assembly protein CpaB
VPRRSGIILISVGLVLAIISAIAVIGIARQATAASQAQVRQVSVVVSARDIPDQTLITADALTIKAFPADFAPPGAYSTTGDLVGKYSKGFVPSGQIIVAGQAIQAPQTNNMSDRIPAGFVVVWLPQPALSAGILKPGDHVDVLLTESLSGGTTNTASSTDKSSTSNAATGSGMSTQTTLQNIEIYRIGDDELGVPPPTTQPVDVTSAGNSLPGSSSSQPQPQPKPQTTTTNSAIGLLVDHQSAVVMKFIKDSGGTIDLVTRSQDDAQIVRTDGVTLDALSDQFNFRVPTTKTAGA